MIDFDFEGELIKSELVCVISCVSVYVCGVAFAVRVCMELVYIQRIPGNFL